MVEDAEVARFGQVPHEGRIHWHVLTRQTLRALSGPRPFMCEVQVLTIPATLSPFRFEILEGRASAVRPAIWKIVKQTRVELRVEDACT